MLASPRMRLAPIALVLFTTATARADDPVASSAAPRWGAVGTQIEMFYAARNAWPSYTPRSTAMAPTFRPTGAFHAVGGGFGLALYTGTPWFIPLLGVRMGGLSSFPSMSSTVDASPTPATYAIQIRNAYGEVRLPGLGAAAYGTRLRFGGAVEPAFHFYGTPIATLTQGARSQRVKTPTGVSFELGLEGHTCVALGRYSAKTIWGCAVVEVPAVRSNPTRALDGATVAVRLEFTK